MMKKILLLATVMAVCASMTAGTNPAHGSRVDQIAARLPERPCTPAPRPCDRAAWAPLAKDPAAAAIIASAEKLVGVKIDELTDDLYRDFSRTGNRVRYETPYFRKAYCLNLFMVAEALEWKGRFVPEIRRYLESILDEKVWTIPATDTKDIAFVKGKPVICLFSANRAWIVAYAANWFADVLPPELVARAKLECRKRVLDLYLAACRNPSLAKGGGGDPLWWFFVRTNWSPVCHAGCVGAALAAPLLPGIRTRRLLFRGNGLLELRFRTLRCAARDGGTGHLRIRDA